MEISVAKGLVELKMLDKRIERAISNATLIGYTVGKKPMTGFDSVEKIEQTAKSDYQSIKDLIKRRNEIKSAIVVSNAKTHVEVAGKEYTVAEAIERKNSIGYEINLLHKMKNLYAYTIGKVDAVNEEVKQRLDEHLKSLYGKEGKTKAAENEAITKPFIEENEAKVIDPLDLKNKIEQLEREIEEFESNVDSVLTESNVLSKIIISD